MQDVINKLVRRNPYLFQKIIAQENDSQNLLTQQEEDDAEKIFREITGCENVMSFIRDWKTQSENEGLFQQSNTTHNPTIVRVTPAQNQKFSKTFNVKQFVQSHNQITLSFGEVPDYYEPYRNSQTEKTDVELRSIAKHVVLLNNVCNIKWLHLQGEKHEL